MDNIFKKNKSGDITTSVSWVFSKLNYYIFLIGLCIIIIGYIVMVNGEVNSVQSLTIAPLLLFTGYIIFIPLSLLYKRKEKNQGS